MFMLSVMFLVQAAPELDTFQAPGYEQPVSGVWYGPGEAASALPLGGLGTGFVDFTSRATFGANTIENTWLRPQPSGAKSGLEVAVGATKVALYAGDTASIPSMRYWGHFPAADVDFGEAFGETSVYLRAFAPLIPHDYTLSNLPAALFRFTVTNRAQTKRPVTLALQWQANAPAGRKAQGNVEGALGWRRATLAPGDVWRVAPVLLFARNRAALTEPLWPSVTQGTALRGTAVPEGTAYAFGAVKYFLLDGFGGFNWETRRRESARFNGAENIGQLLWRLTWGDQRAGRRLDGAFGFSNDGLPAKTADGALEVGLRVVQAGADGVALVFEIENVSGGDLRDLEFGFAANFDLGGPKRAEHQRAEFDAGLKGIVFEDDGVDIVAALVGDADEFIVSTWPQAHQAMQRHELLPFDAPLDVAQATGLENGIRLNVPGGSYAVGAQSDAGWSVQNSAPEPGVIRCEARRTLGPGETADLVLALAWHFAYWTSSDGERVRNRYASAYKDAGEALSTALANARDAQQKVIAWQERVYGRDIPPLLKDALVNGLYLLARNTWWMDDGRFFQSESFTGCPITETFVCRFNGSFPLALLWPECERATMEAVAKAQADSGEIPFSFGRPLGTRSLRFHCQHPIVSSEFVLTTWRNYVLWQDKGYLEAMYPAVKRALRFAMTLDKDGDGLINEDPGSERGWPANQYYDIWPWWGTSAYTASIWLAALRAGEECAKKQGDDAFADELRAWYGRGAKAFEDKLWTGEYYRLYNDPAGNRRSETSLTNALCGQWFAYTCGLGDLVPRSNVNSVIDTVLRLNAAATPYGAVNGVGPNGAVDETFPDHSAVITIGEVWNFCAMAASVGRKTDAIELFEESYANVLLRQRTPWNITWSLNRDTGKLKWGWNYYSNTCVWTLFQALDATGYHAFGKGAGKE